MSFLWCPAVGHGEWLKAVSGKILRSSSSLRGWSSTGTIREVVMTLHLSIFKNCLDFTLKYMV